MNIEDKMGVDALRIELRRAWDLHHAIIDALNELPEFPPPFVLKALAEIRSIPEAHAYGKHLQRQVGLDVIPPVSECELGAGVWSIIRCALIEERSKGGHSEDEDGSRKPTREGQS